MLHLDDGLKLTDIDLALDIVRPQARGYISHAHADHAGRHALALCTPDTAALYQHRYGQRPVRLLPFNEPYSWGPLTLTAYPAGHVLGSSMLLVDNGRFKLLYTGDFHGQPLATAKPAEFPQADVLVMECTFGDRRFQWPARPVLVDRLERTVLSILDRSRVPVIHAYVLGKSQELTRLLSDRGIRVLQHPLVFATSQIYERQGCELGSFMAFSVEALESCRASKQPFVVLIPPRGQKAAQLPLPTEVERIVCSGWAMQPAAAYRLGVDHAIPLSDHAGYNELLDCIEQVQPERIFCTHGSPGFAAELERQGYAADYLTTESVRWIWRFRPA